MRRRTFFLRLALHIGVIDDLAESNAAEQGAEEALLPAAAVGAVEQSHAEVTGEVRPLSKHRVLPEHKSREHQAKPEN